MNKDAVAEMSQPYQVETAQKLVPEGYKQTEVGVIPEDWEVVTISENHQVETGSTPPPSDKNNYGDSYFFVSPADLGDEKVILRTEKMLSKKGFSLSRKFPAGSTLFTCIGSTIGKTGYAPLELTSNQQINAVFPNEENDSNFTYYALTYLAPRVKALAGEQAVPLVNKTSFGETKYPLPPTRKEQEAIGEVLSDTDALLSELEKLIAKKQAIKTATMQQLLTGHTRLPQFAHHPDGSKKGYKQSELGEIPEDWELIELGELLSYEQPTRYLVDSSEYFENGTVPVLTAGKTFILGYTAELDNLYTNLPVIIFDDFTTASKYVDFPFKAKSSAMKMLRPKNEHLPLALIYSALNSIEFKIGDHKRHWISEFSKLKIKWPRSNEEQTAIATILADMDEEIQALEQRLTKTRQIKQGMMQQLLTGKVRLV